VSAGARPKILPNDKVIQTRNNYDLDVMNGAIGVVRSVDPSGLVVDFDGQVVTYDAERDHARDLALAYALTVHKVQGSEFPCVVAVIHKSHSFMHHRNLLYTAVTRAKRTAVIVGDAWGIRNCARRQQVDERQTFLSVIELANDGAEAVTE